MAALALVTNKATGLAHEELSHEDVLAVGAEAGERMIELLSEVVQELGSTTPSERSD